MYNYHVLIQTAKIKKIKWKNSQIFKKFYQGKNFSFYWSFHQIQTQVIPMHLTELYDMFNTQFLKSGFVLKDIKSWI